MLFQQCGQLRECVLLGHSIELAKLFAGFWCFIGHCQCGQWGIGYLGTDWVTQHRCKRFGLQHKCGHLRPDLGTQLDADGLQLQRRQRGQLHGQPQGGEPHQHCPNHHLRRRGHLRGPGQWRQLRGQRPGGARCAGLGHSDAQRPCRLCARRGPSRQLQRQPFCCGAEHRQCGELQLHLWGQHPHGEQSQCHRHRQQWHGHLQRRQPVGEWLYRHWLGRRPDASRAHRRECVAH